MEQIIAKNNFVSLATQTIEKKIMLETYNLDMFANDLFMSKSKLTKKIKLTTGLTPTEFIRNIKFNYAFRLFKETDLSIKEIAYSSGFNDPKYFTRCFKRTYGMSPKEYKISRSNGGLGYMWFSFNMN
jgi:AraC-like DNA-binding protein